MNPKNDEHMIFTVTGKSSCRAEILHDAIVDEIARVKKDRVKDGAVKFDDVDDGRTPRQRESEAKVAEARIQFPFPDDQIDDIAISAPYIAFLLKNGKVWRCTINNKVSSNETLDSSKFGQAARKYEPLAGRKREGQLSDFPGYRPNQPYGSSSSDCGKEGKSVFLTNKHAEEENESNIPQLQLALAARKTALDGASNNKHNSDLGRLSPEIKRQRISTPHDASNSMLFNETPSEMTPSFANTGLDRWVNSFFMTNDDNEVKGNSDKERNNDLEGRESNRFPQASSSLSKENVDKIRTKPSNAASCRSQEEPTNSNSADIGPQRPSFSGSEIRLPHGFKSFSDKLDFMKKTEKKTNPVKVHSPNALSDKSKKPLITVRSFEWLSTDTKDIRFSSISATYSEFLLVSKNDAELWTWPIPRGRNTSTRAFPHPNAEYLGLQDEKISLLDSSIIRTTILTESGKLCTFFDSVFSELCTGQLPNLMQKLTKRAELDPKLTGEAITDIKSEKFYSAALTKSGKVFWWGLTPEHSAAMKQKRGASKTSKSGLDIGDVVALKEKKDDIGTLVMNTSFLDGPKIGWVRRVHDMDRNGDSFDLKHYSVELIDLDSRNMFDVTEPGMQSEKASSSKHLKGQGDEKIWSSDSIVFLEEQAKAIGTIIALDGYYAVVETKTEGGSGADKHLKVCQKGSLLKISESSQSRSETSKEYIVNERRYDEYIQTSAKCIVDPDRERFKGNKAVAISATKRGLTVLLHRTSDGKAFLVHPEGLKEDNSKMFTSCRDVNKSEEDMLKSEGNVTVECEAASVADCNLNMDVVGSLKAPRLITLDGPDVSLLLDNNGCLLPVRYNSCLLQSTVLEAYPLRILRVMETRLSEDSRDMKAFTILAVSKQLSLIRSIMKGNMEKFDEVLQTILKFIDAKLPGERSSWTGDGQKPLDWLYEKGCGNQNIMHLCAANLTPGRQNEKRPGKEVSIGEVYMLRKLLSSKGIRNHVTHFLTERDALGCTPFLTALVTKNPQAAYCILNAVLEWDKAEQDNRLFKAAIHPSSATGMTPLHHLVFNSKAELSPNSISTNALYILNLPANYSPRMLLQLFKERYASAYRALIPAPSEKWKIRTAREKLYGEKSEKKLSSTSSTQHASPKVQASRTLHYSRHLRPPIDVMNRADALRAAAKQGIVMFSDIDEMYQALHEMDRFSLVCEAERPHTGLMSFAKYILSVRLHSESNTSERERNRNLTDVDRNRPIRKEVNDWYGVGKPINTHDTEVSQEVEVPKTTVSHHINPLTRHTAHPTLQSTYLMFSRNDMPTTGLARGLHHQRHIMPHAMRGPNMALSRGGTPSSTNQKQESSQPSSTDSNKKNTQDFSMKDSDDTILCILLTTLLQVDQKFASLLNCQQETALAYYLKNAKRLSPNGLYECLSKWTPCHHTNCIIHHLKCSTTAAPNLLEKSAALKEETINSNMDTAGSSVNTTEPARNTVPDTKVKSYPHSLVGSGSVTVGAARALVHNDASCSSGITSMMPGPSSCLPSEANLMSEPYHSSFQSEMEAMLLSASSGNVKMSETSAQKEQAPSSMEVEENCSPMQKRGRPSTNSPKISEEKDQFQEKDENMPKRKRKDSPFNPELPLEGMLQPERASASPLISNLGPPLLPNFEGLDMPGDVMGSLASFDPLSSVSEEPAASATSQPDPAVNENEALPVRISCFPWNNSNEDSMIDEPFTMMNSSLLDQPLLGNLINGNGPVNPFLDSESEIVYPSSSSMAEEEIALPSRHFASLEQLEETSCLSFDQPNKSEEDRPEIPVKTDDNICSCGDKIKDVSIPALQRFNYVLAQLTSNWWSVAGSILGVDFVKSEEEQTLLSAEKLDLFVSSIVSNPFPIVLDTFLKSICSEFPKDLSLVELLDAYLKPLPSSYSKLIALYSHERLVLPVSKRLVSSVVRRLSLCLSKNSGVDGKLRYEIGRFAKRKEDSKDEQTLKAIRLCLRSFSWLAVIEILKAAEAVIEPVRTGIAKAQPRGIMSEFCGISRSSRAIGPQSILGAIPRLHTPGRGHNMSNVLRSTNMPIASRTQAVSTPRLGPTRLMGEGHSSCESVTNPDNRASAENNNQGNINFANGIENNLNSPLAWTLNGHIRVMEAFPSRALPEYLQNIPDPSMMPSIHAGNCYLAQMYARLVKEAVDLASELIKEENNKDNESFSNDASRPTVKLSKSVEEGLKNYAIELTKDTWEWTTNVMNSIEAQLRSGSTFDTQRYTTRSLMPESSGVDSNRFGRQPNMSQSYISKPEEYLIYLLKRQTDEADNAFPVLDLMSYSHVTFVLDAHFYMLKNWPKSMAMPKSNNIPTNNEMNQKHDTCSAGDEMFRFFALAKDSFEPEVFKDSVKAVLVKAKSPFLWLNSNIADEPKQDFAKILDERDQKNADWKMTIHAFAKLFLAEAPGMERDCFLAEHAGSAGRITRFQRALAAIREEGTTPSSMGRENRPLTISIKRSNFLIDGLRLLITKMDDHPFSCINVRFEGEEGTGPGVNRGFFTGFASVLKSKLVQMENFQTGFLYQPGQLPEQSNVFAPVKSKAAWNIRQPETGSPQAAFLQHCQLVFEGLGRFIGLALWFNQTIPIILTRPVLKYLLQKEDEITFEDLAYHNSRLFDSFAQMILDSRSSAISELEFQDIYCGKFEAVIHGQVEELIPGGSQIDVTRDRVMEYVRLYAKYLMTDSVKVELQCMRNGLHKMIPKQLLDPLTPEDLQLLLSGGAEEIELPRLKAMIRFNNSRVCSKEVLAIFKGWFWGIVEKMTSFQRRQLLYFATGSAALPAFDNKVGNNEELSVTVDVISKTNAALPVVSTCGQRLSIPLYSSKKELKKKLLQAIQCQSYGLG